MEETVLLISITLYILLHARLVTRQACSSMTTFKFCPEWFAFSVACFSSLTPSGITTMCAVRRENRQQKILLYACHNCDHEEVADSNCVYRNEVEHSVNEFTQFLQDVAADPTLPRTKSIQCVKCNHGEAVFFQVTVLCNFPS
ncbi:hypothetical protein Ancab_013005 [Ancistrocladus abbreviatus]